MLGAPDGAEHPRLAQVEELLDRIGHIASQRRGDSERLAQIGPSPTEDQPQHEVTLVGRAFTPRLWAFREPINPRGRGLHRLPV